MILENDTPYNKPNTSERRSRITNPTPYSGLGKLPPQSVDLEEAVLGALMLEKVNHAVFNGLKTEYFYKDSNQKIFNAITRLMLSKTPIDILTVTAQLRKEGELEMIGGAYYITKLTNRVASAANIDYHILIVHQMFIKRELIRIGTECINNMYEDTLDPFHQIASLVKQTTDLEKNIFKQTEKRADQLMFEAIEEMNRPKPKGLLGISTGMKGIDHITQGDQPGQLRIIAARPAMGKTAYMCSEMLNCCFYKDEEKGIQPLAQQTPVGCFSLEMKAIQLTFRMVSNLSDIDNLKIKKNELTAQEQGRFEEYAAMYSDAPIFVDDTPALHIDEFEIKASMMVALHGIKKIYIDYMQLMKGERGKKYGNREAEVSDISRRLKICANELGITIIALCQLSREVEKRKFCKPQLSDLRESGSIEQDADVVMFLWRPEYYPDVMTELTKPQSPGITFRLLNIVIHEYEGLIVCIIAKCREESTGDIPLKAKLGIMRISDNNKVIDRINEIENDLFKIRHNDITAIDIPF